MAIIAEDVRRYRALLMLQEKVMGKRNADVAAKFNVSLLTVERELKWGREKGVLQNHIDKVMTELVPKAMSAIQVALENNDANVALEILKGMNILKKPSSAAPPPPEDTESLEYYMKVTRPKPHEGIPPASSETRPDQGSLPPALLTLEADILPHPEGEAVPLAPHREEGGQVGERDGEE